MSREAFWSMLLLFGGGLALAVVQVARLGEAGTVYTRDVEHAVTIPATADAPERSVTWTTARQVEPRFLARSQSDG